MGWDGMEWDRGRFACLLASPPPYPHVSVSVWQGTTGQAHGCMRMACVTFSPPGDGVGVLSCCCLSLLDV